MSIPVIDIFAGPGGLGEGFTSVLDEDGNRIFNIKLSIEKDEHAHQTLRLRGFYRQFKKDNVPDIYYSYIKENNRKQQEAILKQVQSDYPDEWEKAKKEAWNFELPFELETKKRNGEEYTIGYTLKQINEKHQKIDKRINDSLPVNKDFVLIGGPPCQAYSLVGRSRNQGISNEDHRVHLYREYLRIIAKHHPAVFVMENVKGLLSAKVKGENVFDLIKKDLQNPGSVFTGFNSPKYKIYSFVNKPDDHDENGFPVYFDNKKYLIKTEKYQIPQKRHRVILLGIREDIVVESTEIIEPQEKINLRTVIDNLPPLRSGIGREISGENEKGNHIYSKIENTQINWEAAVSESFNDLRDIFTELNFEREIEFPSSEGANYLEFKLTGKTNPLYNKWYRDERLNGVLNHETRTHLREDLCRYLFSSLWRKEKGDFPKLRDYPDWLLPKHKNAKGGKFADRFRTQRPDEPATTVTSHISKDGHYFIHYDPVQCRSLTVREAARIQTFPDNYYFCGSRTHQYHQVGNAVPPFLAIQIAKVVFEIFDHI